MKSEGEQMRQQLLAGATILEVGAVDLSKYEDELNKITKIQATVRGHLERKRLNRRLAAVRDRAAAGFSLLWPGVPFLDQPWDEVSRGQLSPLGGFAVLGAKKLFMLQTPPAQRQTEGLPDLTACLLYTSPSPRDATLSRMPSSA